MTPVEFAKAASDGAWIRHISWGLDEKVRWDKVGNRFADKNGCNSNTVELTDLNDWRLWKPLELRDLRVGDLFTFPNGTQPNDKHKIVKYNDTKLVLCLRTNELFTIGVLIADVPVILVNQE